MKQVPLSEIKDDFSRFLRQAEKQEIVITRHGKPAGVLIGFASEDDWFDYRLENDPRFLRRIEQARGSLRAGRGVPLERLTTDDEQQEIPPVGTAEEASRDNLADRIRSRVARLGGIDLEIPPRGPIENPRISRRTSQHTRPRKPKRS